MTRQLLARLVESGINLAALNHVSIVLLSLQMSFGDGTLCNRVLKLDVVAQLWRVW